MTEIASSSQNARLKRLAALASTGASLFLSLAKLIVGLITGSLSLVSEGAHNAVDIAMSATTYFAVREADKPADEEHPFGHAKIEAVAALAQTGFLFALAVAVVYAAIRRLSAGAVEFDPSPAAFGVIGVSLVVDSVRWRMLTRIARQTRSDAIAADALHYASDLVSSVCVFLGLVASRFGFLYGDAIAALAVSGFIAVTGFELGRRTLDSLIDAAPKDMTSEVRAFVKNAEGVAGVESLRLRAAGPQVVGELAILVSRTLPLERVAEIKAALVAGLAKRWPELDLTIAANPRALDDESLVERALVVAARRRLFIHHVAVHHVDGRLSLTLDLEVDGKMSVGDAHSVASDLERALRAEVGADVEVETHIEPLETRELAGHAAAPEDARRFEDILSRLAAHDGRLGHIHHVRLRVIEDRGYGIFHCRIAPTASVSEAHVAVDALERATRAEMPELARLVGHVEPQLG